MEKNKLIATCITAVAIIIAGAMIPCAVRTAKSYDRTVDVKGLCEKEVPADKVIWSIGYKVAADDMSEVLRGIAADNRIIREFLVNGGISESEIGVSTPGISDKYAQEYGNNDRYYRYLASGVVTVATADVDKVLELANRQSELLTKGVTLENSYDSGLEFRYESLNEIKPQMIEEATANAREAALKFAKDSGSRIGKIKTASQGTFSIDDRDSYTPYIKKVRVVTYVTYYLKH
ncbi:MAG: SIMPL domain-containing protein [Bacteroidales bacterium]|nr:SIMPL domain-containing protein [Bacteroidales bacterium]